MILRHYHESDFEMEQLECLHSENTPVAPRLPILSIHIEPLSFHVKTTLRKGYSRKFMNVTNPERMAKATLTTTFVWNLKVLALKIAPIMQKRSKLLIRSLCTYFTRYETHPSPRGYSHNKLEALRERKPTPRLVWGAWNSLFWCETV